MRHVVRWFGLLATVALGGCASGDPAPGFGEFLTTDPGPNETVGDDDDDNATTGGMTGGVGDDDDDDDGDEDDDDDDDDDDDVTDDGESDGGCTPEVEICDDLDNDCDDMVDEDFDVGAACETGDPGICSTGTNACTPEGDVRCVADNVPVAEECNGLDDDCDGTPDNDDPGGGSNCRTGLFGVCAAGITQCAGAAGVECVQTTMSSTEACNGMDDDCDGQTDEGIPGVGGGCNTGMAGICASGTNVCDESGGSIICQPDQTAVAETCNNLDDNCNDVVDDNVPGTGGSCATGLPGVCSTGTLTCNGAIASIQCVQDQQAAPAEICGNMLDDDCNGQADDGCGGGTCSHDICISGVALVSGCDPCVTQICAVDPFCCDNSWDSLCISEVETVCGQANCVDDACEHFVCDIGVLMTSTCHPCVTDICAADPFCCDNSWDGLCVGAVDTVCGLTCG